MIDSVTPARVGEKPCSSVSSRGRKAPAPPKAALLSARVATTLGMPGAERVVPGGSSRAAASASALPAMTVVATSATGWPAADSPATESARADRAAKAAQGTRPRALVAAAGAVVTSDVPAAGRVRRRAGSRASAVGTSRTSAPRNTQRQPTSSVITPVTTGPAIEGSTHIAANSENIRGRSEAGRAWATSTIRLMSSTPSAIPLSRRPATTTAIDGAVPTVSWARANSTSPARNGPAGPRRSAHRPATARASRKLAAGAAFAKP